MNGQTQKRKRAQRWGYWSEYLVAIMFMLKGYRIATMRYKTKSGEIDIIAVKGDLIVMAEVKARRNVEEAVNAVTQTAKRRIHSAADLWLSRQPHASKLSIRFDIIAVTPWRWPTHFQDAF